MSKYKIIMFGEELDDVFNSEKDAEEMALYYCSCSELGAEILHMSNPGDYEYDEESWEDPEWEIIEIDD